jgi:glycolate oxidase FAD binding subunit
MGGTRLSAEEATPLWHSLREQTAPFFTLQAGESLWRTSVADTAAPLDLGPTLIEWGGAQRWLKRPAADAAHIRAAAASAHGHATLFRAGSPHDKAAAVFTPLAEPLGRIHRGLKQQFDPAGVFNPHRLSSSW